MMQWILINLRKQSPPLQFIYKKDTIWAEMCIWKRFINMFLYSMSLYIQYQKAKSNTYTLKHS